ncbi:MAG TPA: hypothetical protein VN113_07850 [Caulobacter sp.]|nr:hypothetical protein [Caulobacter sp.]
MPRRDGDIKLRPRTFTKADADMLKSRSDLFARKFDAEVDAEILDILEAHLRTQVVASARSPAIADPLALVVA